ncbi:MAG: alpha/beta-type small acid-soluble spore protein [Clostridiales bacterium]|nr:alpha/beta-type small acid-soluble spore protein [Clostridiales bacterium]MDD6871254.1 alpha/beta-type small acid-soluble spore protein [Clostridiales bacterium]MDD7366737.1 alpha/beta-type small acid-soluble spore protein [Clostridiales bacterium]MDY2873530.1 alpha/beta-type small acid-soluble spore protein [Eubacteriales bacterium]
MPSNNNNQINIPESKNAMYSFKHEVANELGINLKQGYNGDLTSRDAGSIGGMMVKKMIEAQEQQMAGSASRSMNR